MNEDEYLSQSQPQVLLERTARWGLGYPTLHKLARPSERKLRLIGCACLRYLRDELGADLSLAELAAAERFSEGHVDAAPTWPASPGAVVVQPARLAAMAAIRLVTARSQAVHSTRLAETQAQRSTPAVQQASLAATGTSFKCACKSVERHFRACDARQAERLFGRDRRRLCDLIRDVLGNPYRPVVLKPAWLDANRKLARSIAAEIYETGRFADVPILADALEEAGCTDAAILQHARKPRHYRGCWLIDAIVGKS
jgi:hypothetical protein